MDWKKQLSGYKRYGLNKTIQIGPTKVKGTYVKQTQASREEGGSVDVKQSRIYKVHLKVKMLFYSILPIKEK